MNLVSVSVAVAASLLTSVAHAQEPAGASPAACFRGRPLPTCSGFWIVESGLAVRLNSTVGLGQTMPGLATFEVGWMRNRGERTALGATASFGVGPQPGFGTGYYLAIKPRWRRWLSPTTSLDLSPGLIISSEERFPGFTGSADLNFGDWVSWTTQLQVVKPLFGGGTDVGVYSGLKLGSYGGLITGGAAAILLGLFVLVVHDES